MCLFRGWRNEQGFADSEGIARTASARRVRRAARQSSALVRRPCAKAREERRGAGNGVILVLMR